MVLATNAALNSVGEMLMIRDHLMKQTQAAGVGKNLQKRALRCTGSARKRLCAAFAWARHAHRIYQRLTASEGEDFAAQHVPAFDEGVRAWLHNPWLHAHVLRAGKGTEDAAVEAGLESLLSAGAYTLGALMLDHACMSLLGIASIPGLTMCLPKSWPCQWLPGLQIMQSRPDGVTQPQRRCAYVDAVQGNLHAAMRIPGAAPWLQEAPLAAIARARHRTFLRRELALATEDRLARIQHEAPALLRGRAKRAARLKAAAGLPALGVGQQYVLSREGDAEQQRLARDRDILAPLLARSAQDRAQLDEVDAARCVVPALEVAADALSVVAGTADAAVEDGEEVQQAAMLAAEEAVAMKEAPYESLFEGGGDLVAEPDPALGTDPSAADMECTPGGVTPGAMTPNAEQAAAAAAGPSPGEAAASSGAGPSGAIGSATPAAPVPEVDRFCHVTSLDASWGAPLSDVDIIKVSVGRASATLTGSDMQRFQPGIWLGGAALEAHSVMLQVCCTPANRVFGQVLCMSPLRTALLRGSLPDSLHVLCRAHATASAAGVRRRRSARTYTGAWRNGTSRIRPCSTSELRQSACLLGGACRTLKPSSSRCICGGVTTGCGLVGFGGHVQPCSVRALSGNALPCDRHCHA